MVREPIIKMGVLKTGRGIGSAPWTVPTSFCCKVALALLEPRFLTQPEHQGEQG